LPAGEASPTITRPGPGPYTNITAPVSPGLAPLLHRCPASEVMDAYSFGFGCSEVAAWFPFGSLVVRLSGPVLDGAG
jgi:hypothetical protein